MESSTQRLHALDALRGGALLLGVFLHAAMSFIPQATWMVKDTNLSWQLLVGVFTIHIFRMSLFFTIAGFFARMLLEKRGVRNFLRNRTLRIAVPLFVFVPLLLGIMVGVALWAAAWADSGPFAAQPPAADVPDGAADAAQGAAGSGGRRGVLSFVLFGVPLIHLWFLAVLLWLYAVALALVGFMQIVDAQGRIAGAIDAVVRWSVRAHVLPVLLAVPLAGVFLLYLPWTQTGGIPAPDGGLIPNLQSAVAYGTAFGFGWFLHRRTTLMEVWERRWPIYLIAAIVLTVYCARVMGAASDDLSFVSSAGALRYVMMAAYPVAIWLWCIALFGMAIRFLSAENRRIRYLSDSSYWIYLMHMPLVGALQVLVAPSSIGWPWKYLFIMLVAIPVLLISYEWMVRNTWIGAWLNGRRYPKTLSD